MNVEVSEYVGSKYNDNYNNFAFNVSWYTNSVNNIALTLALAKKYFIALSGYNIISAYCYFKNSIYSISSVACSYFSSQSVATNKLVCDKIICNDITSTKIKKNKIVYIYFDGISLPIENINQITPDFFDNIIIPNSFKILIPINMCILIFDNFGKILHSTINKNNNFKFIQLNNLNWKYMKIREIK